MAAAEWEARIRRALEAAGIGFGEEELRRWSGYCRRLWRWNARRRLVGDRDPQRLIDRHLVESLWLAKEVEIGGRRLYDLGSGGGFPAMPLAMGYAPAKTTLIEINQFKSAFLRQEIAEQGLNSEVLELDARSIRGVEGDLVTVRALEKIEDLPVWAGNFLLPGGLLAAWVNRELYEQWQSKYTAWQWQSFIPLPGAERRGIGLARK